MGSAPVTLFEAGYTPPSRAAGGRYTLPPSGEWLPRVTRRRLNAQAPGLTTVTQVPILLERGAASTAPTEGATSW